MKHIIDIVLLWVTIMSAISVTLDIINCWVIKKPIPYGIFILTGFLWASVWIQNNEIY